MVVALAERLPAGSRPDDWARISGAEQPPAQPERGCFDLAENRPGAAARKQAIARKKAAPVRAALGRLFGIHTQERAWRLGAAGEVKVAAKLRKLGPAWHVLHAIPVGVRGADIDHLVIGPGGVYTLNAKHHPGAKIWVAGATFLVNGQRHPYIHNSQYEAERFSRLLTKACGLPVRAVGIVVPVGADDMVIRKEPVGVRVINRRRIHRYLRRRPQVLDQPTVEAIYAVARRSDTWQRR